MKNIYSFLLSMIIVLATLLYYLNITNLASKIEDLTNDRDLYKNRNHYYTSSILSNLSNDNIILDRSLKIFEKNHEPVSFDSIIGDTKFVFRYTNLNCHECIDKQFALLDQFIKKIGKEKILVFTHYTNLRDLAIFQRVNNVKYKIYDIEALNIPLEELQFPYFFVINGQFQIYDSFLPLKNDTNLTINYLNVISEKINKNAYHTKSVYYKEPCPP